MQQVEDVIAKFLSQLKADMGEHASSSMLFPKADPFEHGVQVGIHHGFCKARDLMLSILKDEEETEQKG